MKISRVTIWNDFIINMKCNKATYVPKLTLRVSASYVNSGRGQSIMPLSVTCLNYYLCVHKSRDIQSRYELLKVLPKFLIVRKSSIAKLSTKLIPQMLNGIEIGTLCGPIKE